MVIVGLLEDYLRGGNNYHYIVNYCRNSSTRSRQLQIYIMIFLIVWCLFDTLVFVKVMFHFKLANYQCILLVNISYTVNTFNKLINMDKNY